MRRGTLVLALLVGLVGATGCRPLYGNKPEKQAGPPKKKKPPEEENAVAVQQPKYIEDCPVSFRDEPKTYPKEDKRAWSAAMGDGDAAVIQASKATDKKAKGALYAAAIDKYRVALQKNPYDAQTTLKLAVNYDVMLRKGCALALLNRIGALRRHPVYMKKAEAAASDVAANSSWFAGYRKDANTAVGN